jgi:hypothetical protein
MANPTSDLLGDFPGNSIELKAIDTAHDDIRVQLGLIIVDGGKALDHGTPGVITAGDFSDRRRSS